MQKEAKAAAEAAHAQEINMKRVYGQLQEAAQRELAGRRAKEEENASIKEEVRHLLTAVERVQAKREGNLLKQIMDSNNENARLKNDLRLVSQDLDSALVAGESSHVAAPNYLQHGMSKLEAELRYMHASGEAGALH